MASYHYERLGTERSIRLITLLPAESKDDPVLVRLGEYSLDDAPPYAGLSYTWGHGSHAAAINVNGCDFPVTRNLHNALQQIRHLSQSGKDARMCGLWWIDQICIHQSNNEERSHQVGMMRQIFAKAEVVVAWLGPSQHRSEAVMADLSKGAGEGAGADPTLAFGAPSWQSTPQEQRKFLLRPYWSRMWIIQELSVAKDVLLVCGDSMVNWNAMVPQEYVETTLERMSSEDYPTLIPWNLKDMRKTVQEGQSACLGQMIILAAQSKCSDPRDKIYSLLGLVNTGQGKRLPVNYTISPCQVFQAAARAMLDDLEEKNKEEGNEILQRCGTGQCPGSRDTSISASGVPLCACWWSCMEIALLENYQKWKMISE